MSFILSFYSNHLLRNKSHYVLLTNFRLKKFRYKFEILEVMELENC